MPSSVASTTVPTAATRSSPFPLDALPLAPPPRVSYPAGAFFVLPLHVEPPAHLPPFDVPIHGHVEPPAHLPPFDVPIHGTGAVRLGTTTSTATTSAVQRALAMALGATLAGIAFAALAWLY